VEIAESQEAGLVSCKFSVPVAWKSHCPFSRCRKYQVKSDNYPICIGVAQTWGQIDWLACIWIM